MDLDARAASDLEAAADSRESSPRRVSTSAVMAGRDIARNRAALGILVAVPIVLILLVHATTGDRPIQFQLSMVSSGPITAGERELSLLFIALTSISGVSAFLGFLLMLRQMDSDRRLVFEGYRATELLLAKLMVVVVIAVLVAAYVSALLPIFARPDGAGGVLAGFALASLVYAGLGLALGATVRRELEGILVILLLVNVDAGWLQNPVFYAHAHQQELIRLLPAHYPGQVTMVSAFAGGTPGAAVLASLAYGLAFVLVAALAYWWRTRVEGADPRGAPRQDK